jgi:hypothetical protein
MESQCVQPHVILQPIDYNVANLFSSDNTVAICELAADNVKDMLLAVRQRGWGSVVVETTDNDHFLIVTASPLREGNLIGDIRRCRQHGYRFFFKRAGERFSTPRPNVFVLPGGREIEIRNASTMASNFTHWGLTGQDVMSDGYVRL